MNLKKGFTLIELLVVVAIIGILASVVLALLNSARGKGADATVKANLANIRGQAEIVYDQTSPNSYATVCDNITIAAARAAAVTSGGGPEKCSSNADQWVVAAKLRSAEGAGGTITHWCADFSGKSEGITDEQFDALPTDPTSPYPLCP